MSALLPVFQRYFNEAGVAQAGLKLYTYDAGTTNNKATYYNLNLTTAHSNPIILDANGFPPAQIYGNGAYRVDLKDATGNTIVSRDNVVFDTTSISGGNNNFFIGGALPSDVYQSGSVIALSGDVFYTVEGNKTYLSRNAYLTTALVWKSVNGGVIEITQNNIDGSTKTYKKLDTLTGATYSIAALTMSYERDEYGNEAYNGATILYSLDSNHIYCFRGKTTNIYFKNYPRMYECTNCYMLSGGATFAFIDESLAATIKYSSNGITAEYNVPSTVVGPFSIVGYETKKTDANGNIAYNGATIQADKEPTNTAYVFNGKNCTFITVSGSEVSTLGCYPTTGALYKALTTSPLVVKSVNSATGAFVYYKKSTASVIGTTYNLTTEFVSTTLA